MSKLRYGLIGCGRISPNHIAAVQANQEEIELVAVCDLVPERMTSVLAQVAEGGKYVATYVDYRAMLEQEHLDLVAVATESGSHAQIGLDCIEAGFHVIIEKPMALSIADADRLIKAAGDRNLVLCPCHQNRFNKSIQKIREAHLQNRFGQLLHGAAHIRWNRGKQYYEQAPWRGTWAQDGGALMNQCLHNIDLLRWMMGADIKEVFAYTDRLKHDYIEGEDLGLAVVKFANGAYGLIEGTTNVYPENLEETLYIFGDTGTVKVGGKSVNIIEEWSFADCKDDPEQVKKAYHENPPNVYGFGHTPLYQDVVCAIKESRQPLVDGKAGKEAVELVLAIYKSALEGEPVCLPLEDFSTLDMVGFFEKERDRDFFVHESSYIDDDVRIGKGTKIWHFCHIQSGARVGDDCSFGQNVNVGNNVIIRESVKVQNNVSIYEGVELEDYVFCGPSVVFTNVLAPRAKYPLASTDLYKKTLVKKGASIGANSTIVCGNTIGRYALIGSGAVVTRDVPDHAIVVGNPAKQIGWACECGTTLDKQLRCASCGRNYRANDRSIILGGN